jgi:nucleotidyltransferase/DNA polymerase involved in DNA repair
VNPNLQNHSLDEAYLDITDNKQGIAVASEIAAIIRLLGVTLRRLTTLRQIPPASFACRSDDVANWALGMLCRPHPHR